jgi:hypothetical protein
MNFVVGQIVAPEGRVGLQADFEFVSPGHVFALPLTPF